jgi:hypothetical protein
MGKRKAEPLKRQGKKKASHLVREGEAPYGPPAKRQFRFIDLFCGIRGFRIACERAGAGHFDEEMNAKV